MGSKILKKSIVIILISFSVALILYYLFFDNRFYPVVEGRIYRSAQLSSDDLLEYIREKDIKTILNLRGRMESTDWYKKEKEIAIKNNIQLYDVDIKSNKLPRIDKLMSVLDILLTAQRPLLIHCRRGADRSGLVSAIALSIEEDPPLHVIKKQFSLRYGVLPFYKSAGLHVFEQYEMWLEKTKRKHSKRTLLYWLKNEYVDFKGNLIYWIDTLNDKRFYKGGTPVLIDKNTEELKMRGWAFDFRTKTPSNGILYVRADNRISSKAVFKYNRPDVARYFNLDERYYKTFPVGWDAKFKVEDLSKGCHKIYLQYVKNESTTWDFDTIFEFCLN